MSNLQILWQLLVSNLIKSLKISTFDIYPSFIDPFTLRALLTNQPVNKPVKNEPSLQKADEGNTVNFYFMLQFYAFIHISFF